MFGIMMPWTRSKLRREEERKRIDAKYKAQEAAWEAKREENRAAYNKALIARTGVIQLSDARLAQKLTAQAVAKNTPRPGYVTDYTSTTDSDDLAMFAAPSFIDGLTAQNSSYRSAESASDPSPSSDSGSSASSDSGSSSSCDSGSSSSDSGSCSSDSSSW